MQSRLICLLMGILLPVALSGCAWKQAMDDGAELMAAKKYCEAMDSFKLAAKLKQEIREKVPDYDDRLNKARKACSKTHYNNGISFTNKGQLNEAIDALKTAIELDPGNLNAADAHKIAVAQKAENEAQAEERFRQGSKHLANRDWHKASAEFKSALSLNINHITARAKLSESDEKIKEVDLILGDAEKHISKKEWLKAILYLEKIKTLAPFHPTASKLLETSNSEIKTANENYEKGKSLFTKGKVADAEKMFTVALSHDPSHIKSKEMLASILYQNAALQNGRKNFGNALKEYLRIRTLMPGYKDINSNIDRLSKIIANRATYRVALLPLENRSGENGLQEKILDQLSKKLKAHKQDRIVFISDSEFKDILRKSGLSSKSLLETDRTELIKKLPGIDVIISGSITSFSINQEEEIEDKTHNYQSGSNRVRNPQYDALKEQLDQTQAQINSVTNPWAKVAFQTTMTVLRGKLQSELQYIQEPVYSDWNYQVKHISKNAELKIAFRVKDITSDNILFDDTVNTTLVSKGDTVLRSNPKIGVQASVAKLKSTTDMREALIGSSSDEASNKFFASFGKYGIKFLKAAELQMESGKSVDAVESYFNFLYSAPSEENHAEEIKKTLTLLEITEIPNAPVSYKIEALKQKTASDDPDPPENSSAGNSEEKPVVKRKHSSAETTSSRKTEVEASEIIDMKKGVKFTHKKHATTIGDCKSCHSGNPGKITGFGKDWSHKNCKSCHNDRIGPTSCKGCHK